MNCWVDLITGRPDLLQDKQYWNKNAGKISALEFVIFQTMGGLNRLGKLILA